MKIVVQKVRAASVEHAGEVRSIGQGLVVLLGIRADDFDMDADYVVGKVLGMQLWDDGDRTWRRSVVDVQGEVLVVSQFTFYGYLKGNRPDFHHAMGGERSRQLYEEFLAKLRQQYGRVQNGFFGQEMLLRIENDGPCTIVLDSRVEARAEGTDGMAKIGGPKALKRYERLQAERAQ